MKLWHAIVWLLVAVSVVALLAALSGCVGTTPKAAPTVEWEAPEVQCEQAKTPDLPPPPMFWFLDGPAYVAEVLGTLTEERRLRGVEHACLQDHRARGLIR